MEKSSQLCRRSGKFLLQLLEMEVGRGGGRSSRKTGLRWVMDL